MTDTYSTMTDITMEELLIDLMSDYTDYLQDDGVKDEILEKFYDNPCFTLSGMTKEQAYNFHNKLSKTYDVVVELELEFDLPF
mgnify:FL=1